MLKFICDKCGTDNTTATTIPHTQTLVPSNWITLHADAFFNDKNHEDKTLIQSGDHKWHFCSRECFERTFYKDRRIPKGAIRLSKSEINSGSDRIVYAEGLILQLPKDHEGRNTWLLNYGVRDEAKELRRNHPKNPMWDYETRSAELVGRDE